MVVGLDIAKKMQVNVWVTPSCHFACHILPAVCRSK